VDNGSLIVDNPDRMVITAENLGFGCPQISPDPALTRASRGDRLAQMTSASRSVHALRAAAGAVSIIIIR